MNFSLLLDFLGTPNFIVAIIVVLAFFYFISKGKKIFINIKNIILIYFEDLREKKHPTDEHKKYFTEE
jgi:hypothetical protein